MNYLALTNSVLSELNEVQLTSTNFSTSSGTQVTYAGQQEYTLPTDYRSVDYDSFYIVPTELVTNSLFASDISNWTTSSGTPAYNATGNGRMRLNDAAAYATLATVKNTEYKLQIRLIDSASSGSTLKIQVGTSIAGIENLNTTLVVSNIGDGNILSTTFTATASTTYLTLDNDSSNNLDIDFVKVSENMVPKKLTFITYDDYRRRFLNIAQTNSNDHYGVPDYVYRSQDGYFGLHRIPSSDKQTIKYEYWKTHADLDASTDTPDMPARFHDVIISRAKYYLYQLRSDPQFTQLVDRDYREGIKRMRIELINSPTEMLDKRINFGRSRGGSLSG